MKLVAAVGSLSKMTSTKEVSEKEEPGLSKEKAKTLSIATQN
jgi:hypothetical protein